MLEDGKGGSGAAFVLNAVTYLLSAFFISRADVPGHEARPQAPNLLAALGLTDLAEGARFVAREPGVRLMLFAKAGWSLAGGGALMLYTVFGERVFPIGKGAASGIGLLYAARGVGALLGPTAARVWKGDSEPALERAIGFGFPLMVAAYLLLAGAPSIGVAAAAVVLAHIAASVIWTFSTSLLNLRVPDRLKGRAFALDAAITTVSLIASTLATAWGLDRAGLSPRAVMAALALVGIAPAIAWRLLPRAPATAVGREGSLAKSRAVEPG